MYITPSQAPELLIDAFKAGLVPNIHGSPGVGKSDIMRQIALENNLQVIDFRLSQADPTDLNGFPVVNEKRDRSDYAPPALFPLSTDPIPDGYKGWLLFFDEINSAAPSVQAAAYKIILDRMIGQHKIHPKLVMACAGNLTTDKAIVNRLSTAMQSRLIHLNLEVNLEDWLDWAITSNIDYRVTSFIQFRTELLHKFDPNHNDHTFPCPRTWFFVSQMIKSWDKITDDKLPLLAGTVGEGAAMEFKGFTDIIESVPSITEILRYPENIGFESRPDILYALGTLVTQHVTDDNIEKLVKFVNRMPLEFQVITYQHFLKKDVNLQNHKSLKQWIKENAQSLI